MIFYLSPFSPNCDIGGIYNRQIAHLPDDCWICITDQDILFLLPDTKRQIQEIADKGEFELYGCMTNRLGWGHQLHNGKISKDGNIQTHIEIAKDRQSEFGNEVLKSDAPIAGFLMLFRKSTWQRVGGFVEKSKIFDQEFSLRIHSKGLMTGVYVFHLYRWGSKMPEFDSSHLDYRK